MAKEKNIQLLKQAIEEVSKLSEESKELIGIKKEIIKAEQEKGKTITHNTKYRT